MEKSIWNGRYKPVKELGDGAFAEVWLCQDLKSGCEARLLSDESI